jgi:hypothetical protein
MARTVHDGLRRGAGTVRRAMEFEMFMPPDSEPAPFVRRLAVVTCVWLAVSAALAALPTSGASQAGRMDGGAAARGPVR